MGLLLIFLLCGGLSLDKIDESVLDKVTVGETTTGNVLETFGRPYYQVRVGPKETWYYMFRVQNDDAVVEDAFILEFREGVLTGCVYEHMTDAGVSSPKVMDITTCDR